MGIIETKLKHILTFNLDIATQQILSESRVQKRVIELNQSQLNEGRGASGILLPAYAKKTLTIKPANLIPASKTFNLKSPKGTLHRKMFVRANTKTFTISSSDSRLGTKLQEGTFKQVEDNEAFGLTTPNREVLTNQILIPSLQRKLRGK